MPINKPIPDSIVEYWKKVFKDFQENLVDVKNQSEIVERNNHSMLMKDLLLTF